MAAADTMRVELAWLDGVDCRVVPLELPVGATAREALRAGGFVAGEGGIGLFGRMIAEDAPLANGDRLELYQPLRVDPKTARRRRAAVAEKKRPGR